ncbi:hypothetical protein P170DRAFT_22606 [Aspergillus steynii IBT 23096]|uniref:Uncharacterized protein n=1 Tax=Aspergillus steynii IBT 23096 TaxID=1392250 RepID=A0A2I2GP30_9EURO|nr:uncharacterized protein P170DRAFT_22606 [Aspergillus steynii IBT 23096]PLB54623.1 hypothetical protein P170DRAFT_22606 [Aspergillus steynii IBT 23096]
MHARPTQVIFYHLRGLQDTRVLYGYVSDSTHTYGMEPPYAPIPSRCCLTWHGRQYRPALGRFRYIEVHGRHIRSRTGMRKGRTDRVVFPKYTHIGSDVPRPLRPRHRLAVPTPHLHLHLYLFLSIPTEERELKRWCLGATTDKLLPYYPRDTDLR